MTGRRPHPYTSSFNQNLRPTPVAATKSVLRWPSAHSPRPCPYCGKVFPNMNALGGHMSAHRDEIEVSRKEHRAFLDDLSLSLAPPGSKNTKKHESKNKKGLDTGDMAVHRGVTEPARQSVRRQAGADRPLIIDFLGLGPLILGDEGSDGSSDREVVAVENGGGGDKDCSVRRLEFMGLGLDLSLKL